MSEVGRWTALSPAMEKNVRRLEYFFDQLTTDMMQRTTKLNEDSKESVKHRMSRAVGDV